VSLLLLLWGLLSIPPAQAAHVAGAALDVDGDRLRAICLRESRCQPVGVHEGDAWVGPVAYRRARERGWLSCPLHADADPRRYGTRGPFGEIAAYTLRGWCLPPEVLDIPLGAAFFAGLRLRRVEQGRALPATQRWAGS
jgi:hypothetical protein